MLKLSVGIIFIRIIMISLIYSSSAPQTTLVSTGPQLFQCTQCIIAPFKSKSMLRTHILVAHERVKRHFCRFCNYSNTFPLLVDSHTNAHHTKTVLYECDSDGCDFETHSKVTVPRVSVY